MTFLFSHPFFLAMLPLALVPVLFHLFFRIRRKAVAFSTFMFFQRIHPRLSARRKVREWLILLLRALAVALFLLALAGAIWKTAGGGGRTAVVLVLDNSASMSRRAESGDVLLGAAKEAAAAALDTLDTGDSAALILTVRDAAAPDAGLLSRDRDALKAALQAVPPTEASGRPVEALQRAVAQLATAPAVQREIHIFTDLQENEWARTASSASLPGGITLRIHRLDAVNPSANATILGVSLPPVRRLALRRLPLSVRIRGSEQPCAVLLNWIDDAGRPGAVEARLAAGEEKAIILPLAPRSPGSYAVPIWLTGDEFEADNKAVAAFDVSPGQTVLFIGPRSVFGFLPAALAPGGNAALSGLDPVFVEPSEAVAALASQPLLVVVAWSRLPAAGVLPDALLGYVRKGGRLLAVPDANPEAVSVLGTTWLGVQAGKLESPLEGARVIPLEKGAGLFDPLRGADGQVRLGQARAMRFVPLTPSADASALLGLEDGRALLTERREGEGRIYASGLGMSGDWSTLPLKPAFLALTHQFALSGNTNMPMAALKAGDAFPLLPPGKVRLQAALVPPIDWQGDSKNLPAPARSGEWTVESASGTVHYAVSSDPGEGLFKDLENGPVPALLGLPHSVEPLGDAGDLAARIRRERKGMRLLHPFLIACLLALVAESLLANPRINKGS